MPRIDPQGSRACVVVVMIALVATAGCKFGRTGPAPGASKRWDDMDTGEKTAHMAGHVAPKMAAVFAEYDASRFADFDCGTCHGEGAARGDYAMPNPALPILDPRGLYKKHRKENPEAAKFMWKRVEPMMAEALGVTHGPAGRVECGSCHRLQEQ